MLHIISQTVSTEEAAVWSCPVVFLVKCVICRHHVDVVLIITCVNVPVHLQRNSSQPRKEQHRIHVRLYGKLFIGHHELQCVCVCVLNCSISFLFRYLKSVSMNKTVHLILHNVIKPKHPYTYTYSSQVAANGFYRKWKHSSFRGQIKKSLGEKKLKFKMSSCAS